MGAKTYVYLITGFLGSGKTTFLNRIIEAFPSDRKLMILMNEFGEVGVDGTLVEGEDMDLLEISKGSIFCVCVKTDFIKALNEIAATTQPDVLLIESTGVANPTDLKRDLKLPFFKGRFEMSEQFCIIDAVHFAEEYETFASVEKQIASSSMFLINKVDLASAEQVEAIKALVHEHHPSPRFFETTYTQAPLEELFPNLMLPVSPEEDDSEYLAGPALEQAIDDMLDDPDREITPPDRLLSAVYLWSGTTMAQFEELLDRMPKSIIRAKGFFNADGQVRLYSQVMSQRDISAAELPPERRHLLDKLVFIAPPESIAELEETSRDLGFVSQYSVLDPMAEQG